jgi:indolepyruvate ferredoxin oxidoreductase beta subunit
VLARVRRLPRAIVIEGERLAREAGNPQTLNTVMVGAASHLLPMAPETYERALSLMFARKGEDVLRMNLAAFRAGHAAAVEAPRAATAP